jgi:hypothetical protein
LLFAVLFLFIKINKKEQPQCYAFSCLAGGSQGAVVLKGSDIYASTASQALSAFGKRSGSIYSRGAGLILKSYERGKINTYIPVAKRCSSTCSAVRIRAIKRIGPHDKRILEIIFGSLLGDGHAEYRSKGKGTRITFFQEGIHVSYLL